WLYYRIFQGLDPKASQQVVSQLTNAKKSILDYVLQDAASLRAKLSAADKVTLDAHLTEIREIEQSLANTVPSGSSCSTDPYPDFANLAKGIDFQPYGVNSWNEGPGGRRFSHECFIRLTTMAFRCNATNVVSYHDSGSTIGYNFWRNSSDYTINVNELKTRKMPNGATRYTNQSLLDALIRSLKWNDSNGKYIEG